MSCADWSWISRAGDRLEGLEAWLGAFVASLMAVSIGIPSVLGLVEGLVELRPKLIALLGVATALWAWFDTRHLYWTWTCLRRGDRPLAPAVARRQPTLPLLLRPLVAAWWLIHFAMGLAMILAAEQLHVAPTSDLNPAVAKAVVTAVTLVFAFGYALAAHGYLLMMVAALAPTRGWVEAVWRWRLAIDLAFVVLAAFVPWPSPKVVH